MRKFTSIISSGIMLFFLFGCHYTFGQQVNSTFKKMYLNLGAGVTNADGTLFEGSVLGVLKKDWVVSLSYNNIEMNAKNLPDDYKQGFTIVVAIPVSDGWPYTTLNIFSLTGGKRFATGRTTWFTTEAGLSIVGGQELTFTPQEIVINFPHTSSNYAIQKESKIGIGGMLKADFNWAFTPYLGIGAGGFVNFNQFQTPVGGHVKLILGWLNTKKKK